VALLEYEKFSGTGDLDLTARGKSQLYGILVRESATTPAAATVLVRNGGATGDVVVPVELAANESKAIVFPHPVRFPGGVYVDVAAGEVEGSVVGQWGS